MEVEGDLVQAHTQGGSWGGSGPGPHPRGKLRGIWSRPTPKGEVEGDLVQAHTQGGSWGGSGPGPHPRGKLRGIWLGGCVCSRGCLIPGGSAPGGMPTPRGVSAPGGSARGRGVATPLPRDGYCCRRYASYWNAFLFQVINFNVQKFFATYIRVLEPPFMGKFLYFYIIISQQWENGLAWRLSWLFNHDFMCTHLSPLLLVTTQEICHSPNDSARIAKTTRFHQR